MNQKNKTTIIAAFLLAAFSLSFGASASFNRADRPSDEERSAIHTEVDEAIQSGDYDAWKEIISESPRGERMLEHINADNFDKFVEAYNLRKEGRELMDKSRLIMEDLGFEKGDFHKKGNRQNNSKRGNR